ncbi:hypothetical protein AB1Y20_015343 [Prymnesium parvum]|uniref:Uncharacterized protein n=1 Tax=Prymnesium parvum TaxID=97485 RepID=A0AB34JY46_PRYPA
MDADISLSPHLPAPAPRRMRAARRCLALPRRCPPRRRTVAPLSYVDHLTARARDRAGDVIVLPPSSPLISCSLLAAPAVRRGAIAGARTPDGQPRALRARFISLRRSGRCVCC